MTLTLRQSRPHFSIPRAALCVAAVASLAGCVAGAEVEPDPTTGRTELQPLKLAFFDECVGLDDYMKKHANEQVTAWGLSPDMWAYGRTDIPVADGEVMMSEQSDAAAPAGDAKYSGTNTQEAGVDEGDLVETDGNYLYTLMSGGLVVVDIAAGEVVSRKELNEGTHQMILSGNTLVVVSSSWASTQSTVVTILDVSDPANLEVSQRTHFEGAVSAVRSSGGKVHLVIHTNLDRRLEFVSPETFGYDEAGALARNKEIIATSEVADWLPRQFEERGDGTFEPMVPALDCADVAAPEEWSGLGITWVAHIDLATRTVPVPAGSAGVVSNTGIVYANETSLYVTTTAFENFEIVGRGLGAAEPIERDDMATVVHRFALDDGATYTSSGVVKGRLLNQFAMSEHNNHLRVASTVDDNGNFGEQSYSAITVLDADMAEVGYVDGLGITEQIYAVRFIGDVGYVVTFRQTDPLYVVDLSDPTNPVVEGELKIPGYSAYLHPVGEGLILGVGQDADDTGRTTGTQVSLFDVSDPKDPQRVDTVDIGGYSDVEWDHRAFLYWGPTSTAVIPVSGNGRDYDSTKQSSVIIDVAELTLNEVGSVVVGGDGCWVSAQRNIVVGDELVNVTDTAVTVSDFVSLEERATILVGQNGCEKNLSPID